MKASPRFHVEGHVSPGYEAVRDAFMENFARRHELGGACCIYHHGEKVVDIWGGIRNNETGEPWQENTMVLVHSATKGLAAMTLAVAHSRGWLDYDERVCSYWPEFAQEGKETTTVRQLLAHQAGLFALDEPIDRSLISDFDRLAVVLAHQKPVWEPGTRQAYHAITLGFFESELLRRVDPKHRSLGQFFQDEIATPLGLDFYIRLPDSIPNSRLATLASPNLISMLFGFGIRFSLIAINPRSNIMRALKGSELARDEQRIYARNLEIPSGGGVGTARAIARAYSVFATSGKELGLCPDTLEALSAPAVPAKFGFHDECFMGDAQFLLGFMKSNPSWRFGSDGSFGSPGAGGSLGFADPKCGIAYAYVTCRMGTSLTGDPRDIALREALYSLIPLMRAEPSNGGQFDGRSESTNRKALLVCGILAALCYAAMNVFVPLLYKGYSQASQTVSELSAIGAPTRPLWVVLGALYTLLLGSFGLGICKSAGRNRPLRAAGVLMIVTAVLALFWPPMHQRGTVFTLTDTLHILWTMMWGMLSLLAMGFGSASFGKRFRIYTIVSMVTLVACGFMTSLDAPNIQANLPTPWAGVWERINIGVYLLWLVALAMRVLRSQDPSPRS